LIQALVLLRSYLQCPLQVSPHPHSPRLLISPSSGTPRLGWQCHTLPMTPPPSPPNMPLDSSSLSPRVCLSCSQSMVFWGRDHARALCMPVPHRSAAGSQVLGLQGTALVPQPSLPLPFPGHTALSCSRRHVRTVISLRGCSLVRSEIFTVLTKARLISRSSSSPVPITSASHTAIYLLLSASKGGTQSISKKRFFFLKKKKLHKEK